MPLPKHVVGREEEGALGGPGGSGVGHYERRQQIDGTGNEIDERVALDHLSRLVERAGGEARIAVAAE
jgi:hypothetical protein